MKKVIAFGLVFASFALAATVGHAEDKQKVNLNVSNMVKASKVIQNNRALFNNPEAMARFRKLAASLQKAKEDKNQSVYE